MAKTMTDKMIEAINEERARLNEERKADVAYFNEAYDNYVRYEEMSDEEFYSSKVNEERYHYWQALVKNLEEVLDGYDEREEILCMMERDIKSAYGRFE